MADGSFGSAESIVGEDSCGFREGCGGLIFRSIVVLKFLGMLNLLWVNGLVSVKAEFSGGFLDLTF